MKSNICFITLLVSLLFLFNFGFCQELPKLKSGKNLRNILMESSKFRWSSGYSILEFRINEKGEVDSTIVTSTYYARDTFALQTDRRDHAELKALKFEPQEKSVWIQCKVYKYLHNNRTMDIDDPTRIDQMRLFNYGFEDLWKNEIKTYFTAPDGKVKEYIISNDKVIVAPVYIYAIT